MRSSIEVALTLLVLTSCISLPATNPNYASYESHISYDSSSDEVRWIECVHGAQASPDDESLKFFDAFAHGQRIYPTRNIWSFDLEPWARNDDPDPAHPERQLIAAVAQRIEVIDSGLYADGPELVGAWRRSRIREASGLVAELNELIRLWARQQCSVIESPEHPRPEQDERHRWDYARDYILAGGNVLRLEGDKLVVELPLSPEDAPYDWAIPSDHQPLGNADREALPIASVEIAKREDGVTVLRASTASGWMTASAPAWMTPWQPSEPTDEEMQARLRGDGSQKAVLEAGLTLGPKPDLECLKRFEPGEQ